MLRVEDVSLLNGHLTTGDGAGIRNAGNLVLDNAVLADNVVQRNIGNGRLGGGIYNTGRALIHDTLITANFALDNTGAAGSDGGGVYNNGDLTISGSRLIGNVAVGNGGAIFNAPGHATRITQSSIESNSVVQDGGGIYNRGAISLDRTLVRFNQTIINNGPGGGISNAGGTMTLRNSTVHQNNPYNCAPLNSIPGCAG
jgi:hypothetical protein